MARGSIARRTITGTDANAAFELIANSPTGCRLKEILITLAAATASTYGLGRPQARGVTPTTPVSILSENSNAGQLMAQTALAWGTPPTVPTQFFRRVSFPNVISSSILWKFEEGLYIPSGGTLVLWNLASNGVVDVTVLVDE